MMVCHCLQIFSLALPLAHLRLLWWPHLPMLEPLLHVAILMTTVPEQWRVAIYPQHLLPSHQKHASKGCSLMSTRVVIQACRDGLKLVRRHVACDIGCCDCSPGNSNHQYVSRCWFEAFSENDRQLIRDAASGTLLLRDAGFDVTNEGSRSVARCRQGSQMDCLGCAC